MYHKILGILVCLLLILACVHPAIAKDRLVIGIQDDTASLDPAKSYETVPWGIQYYVYEKLVRLGGDNYTEPIPELAESWEIDDDGTTWTFFLRKDAVFASGNPVNADAVVFSFNRVLDLGGDPSWLLSQFGLKEETIIKVDDHTVQLILNQKYAPGIVLSCLATAVSSILDPQLVMEQEQDGDLGSAWLETHSAGSGPYIIEKRVPKEMVVLTENTHYYKEKPTFQQVLVKNVPDPLEQMALLEQGVIDIAWNLESEQISMLAGNSDIQIFESLTFMLYYAAMNLGYEPFANADVRDAVRYAINYDEIINTVLDGAALSVQSFIPKGIPGYTGETPYTRDIEKARQLLNEAGYSDGFDVELLCFDYAPWFALATKFKADLADVGIRVTVTPLPVEQVIEAYVTRNAQFTLILWLFDYADPDANAKGFAHSDSIGDDATIQLAAWWNHYVNPETSELVEQAAQELDAGKRREMYETIARIIMDDGPFVFFASPLKQYGVRAEVADSVIQVDIAGLAFPIFK